MKIISYGAHMDPFTYRHAEFTCESISFSIVADSQGTPTYVDSRASFLDTFATYERPAEGLADGDRHTVGRRRVTHEDLVAGEETS